MLPSRVTFLPAVLILACAAPRPEIFTAGQPTVVSSGTQVTLANSHLSLTFDTAHGLSLASLVQRSNGRDYGGAASRLFVLGYQGSATACDARDFAVAAVTPDDDGGETRVTFALTPTGPCPLDLTLSVGLSAAPQASWDLTVHNATQATTVVQVVYPHLAGLDVGADAGHFFPMRSGMVSTSPIEVIASYGGPAWMQWMDVHAPTGGGLMLWSQDTTGRYKFLALSHRTSGVPDSVYTEYDAHGFPLTFQEKGEPNSSPLFGDFLDGVGMAIGYLPIPLVAAQSMSVPQAVSTVHAGDWREALSIYKAWSETWWQHEPAPDWFRREMLIWQGEPPAGSRGVNRWEPTFWSQLHKSPDDPAAPNMDDFGTTLWSENLAWWQETAQDIVDRGGRMGAYLDAGEIMATTELAAAHGKEWTLMDLDGTARYFTVDKPGSITDWWRLCPAAIGWREWLTQAATTIVSTAEISGIYLDTYGALAAIPEYNPSHGHASPDAYISGVAQTYERVRAGIRAVNPEAAVFGEEPGTDYIAQFADGSYDGGLTRPSPAREPAHNPLGIHFFRFVYPSFKTWVDMSLPGEGAQLPTDAVALRWHRLALYNGLGIWGPAFSSAVEDYGTVILPILRAHADAFTSADVAPAIPTSSPSVYANRFSTAIEDVYTFYNHGTETAVATLAFQERPGRVVISLVNATPVTVSEGLDGTLQATVSLGADDVTAIAYQ